MNGNLLKDVAQKWPPIVSFQIPLIRPSPTYKMEKYTPFIVNHGKGREERKNF